MAFICLGSNLGDADENIDKAIALIASLPGVNVVAVSPSYYTEPQELREQPWFANRVARLECDAAIEPDALIENLLAIETALGRRRNVDAPGGRFGPRVIDIDLLAFGNAVRHTDVLTLPHPRMEGRAFVLVPLRDVAPDYILSGGRSIDDVLANLPYRLEGRKIWQ